MCESERPANLLRSTRPSPLYLEAFYNGGSRAGYRCPQSPVHDVAATRMLCREELRRTGQLAYGTDASWLSGICGSAGGRVGQGRPAQETTRPDPKVAGRKRRTLCMLRWIGSHSYGWAPGHGCGLPLRAHAPDRRRRSFRFRFRSPQPQHKAATVPTPRCWRGSAFHGGGAPGGGGVRACGAPTAPWMARQRWTWPRSPIA